MKTLKHKIQKELLLLEAEEMKNPNCELDSGTLTMAYKLAKALHYLHKASEIIEESGVEEAAPEEPEQTEYERLGMEKSESNGKFF